MTYGDFCQHVFGWMLDEGEGNQPRLCKSTSYVIVHDELGNLSDSCTGSHHWDCIHVEFPATLRKNFLLLMQLSTNNYTWNIQFVFDTF